MPWRLRKGLERPDHQRDQVFDGREESREGRKKGRTYVSK
jgi:hypothetical protein